MKLKNIDIIDDKEVIKQIFKEFNLKCFIDTINQKCTSITLHFYEGEGFNADSKFTKFLKSLVNIDSISLKGYFRSDRISMEFKGISSLEDFLTDCYNLAEYIRNNIYSFPVDFV